MTTRERLHYKQRATARCNPKTVPAWLVTHPSGVRYRVEAGRLESTLLNLRADGNDEFMVEAAPELLPVPELERAEETFPEEWAS